MKGQGASLMLLLLLCVAVTFTPGHCETKEGKDESRARLPEFLSELDLASVEASEEDVEALKKIVKRLAPEKNGEYQVYQVFFGNEDLLKEWLKGAGVTGQPGVDFPALTSIPATSFSCRGLKGGYYADLETNCQVFHICDNGRKISFLCPNGTIFQQSQLICDWWFKVDCSKSTELYEQSAEQLAEEERKRADAKKMKSEFHRTLDSGNGGETYFENHQNDDYDGRQNGRMNPYGQSAKQNQIQDNQDLIKQTQHFNPNNIFVQQSTAGRGTGNEFSQPASSRNSQSNENSSTNQKQKQYQENYFNDYQSSGRPQNQLVEAQPGKFTQQAGSYDQRGSNKYQVTNQDYQDTLNGAQDYYGSAGSQNVPRNEKPNFRNSKSRTLNRNNSNNLNNLSSPVQKVTPTYTETTTFRTTTANPVKEFQQLAESAAFVSNRNNNPNRYNSGNGNSGSHQYYYQSYENRGSSSNNAGQDTSAFTSDKGNDDQPPHKPRFNVPPFPGPTFTPIYKPRTSTVAPHETTLPYSTTSGKASYNNRDYYGQNFEQETTYSTADTVTVTPYSTTQDYQTSTVPYVAADNNGNGYQQNFAIQRAYHTNNDATNPSTQRSYSQTSYYGNTDSYNDNRVTGREASQETGYSTTRSYVNTETYRQNTVTANTITDAANRDYAENTVTTSQPTYFVDANVQGTDATSTQSTFENRDHRTLTDTTAKVSNRTSQNYRQNIITASTEKSARNTQSYQSNTGTGKTLSPYDTSFTYKQGKVMSTLGPYVPFTKNYIYSASSTSKPPVYTATVPSFSSTAANYRVTAKNLIPKIRTSSTVPLKAKGTSGYLPDSQTNYGRTPFNRPSNEKEHALNMLHSLQTLGNDVPSLTDPSKINSRISSSSGPSTLHSLALYFATASDNFDSNETADSAVSIEYQNAKEDGPGHKTDNTSVELPKNILTQHTITSYTELFKLNNALEGNVTTEDRFGSDGTSDSVDQDDDDLDIQQSEGPLSGAKRSNNTKLRELAQVFTHALSAYLQDPDTFKKVLTEIRPTEPTTITTDGLGETTTLYPTTVEEYPSVTKEKDEVLDFSDDSSGSRRRKPTTAYPTTVQPSTTPRGTTYQSYYTTPTDYYTTTIVPTQNTYSPTTLLPTTESANRIDGSSFESSTQSNGNTFAFEVNRAFGSGTGNDVRNYNSGSSGPSGSGPSDSSQVYENYFPGDYNGGENRIGGFQNNTGNTLEPYGKNVKPFDATPINDNYVASSTPSTYVQTPTNPYNKNKVYVSKKPDQELTPPFYESYESVDLTTGPLVSDVSNSLIPNLKAIATTPIPKRNIDVSSTHQPFRIRYYDSTTPGRRSESIATAKSSYVNFRNFNRQETRSSEKPFVLSTTLSPTFLDPGNSVTTDSRFSTIVQNSFGTPDDSNTTTTEYTSMLGDNHWTSSPMVTQLWETTVFIDPKRINHGLESDSVGVTQSTPGDFTVTERLERSTTPSSLDPSTFVTVATTDSTVPRTIDNDLSTPWKWVPNNNDSPTAFTLLPTAFPNENTATPTPVYTTRSSITTTITSSVTSTSALPQENIVTSLLPYKVTATTFNVTENEILKAQEMFGKLNASSSNTLMRVMKQADNNETVRQLVLLLISHCNGPMNKTQEEEKEQLLNALLKMPVNEFTSDESRELVASINRLNLPSTRTRFITTSRNARVTPTARSIVPSTSTTTQPSVTTFRSRKGRKFRTTTENTANLARRSDVLEAAETSNGLSEKETNASDSRAIELLRSLYTIAAKWG